MGQLDAMKHYQKLGFDLLSAETVMTRPIRNSTSPGAILGSGVIECCSSDKLRPRPNREERVSRKDAKIGVKAAKKPAEKNEILRVCFAGGLLVAAPPAAVYAAFRRLIASDFCFFLQGCLTAFAPIFASLRETLLSCPSTQLPQHPILRGKSEHPADDLPRQPLCRHEKHWMTGELVTPGEPGRSLPAIAREGEDI